MRKIIYYVAASVDGYISGENNDVSGFIFEGKGVDKYLNDIKSFDTVIMGRKTYEFGYQYGLKPGEPAYPHMDHYIFSNNLHFENPHEKVKVCAPNLQIIMDLKEQEGTDIYLCGGGEFAGWLLAAEQIDILKIKLNPLILGAGIRLFGSSLKKYILERLHTDAFDHGLQILTYKIIY